MGEPRLQFSDPHLSSYRNIGAYHGIGHCAYARDWGLVGGHCWRRCVACPSEHCSHHHGTGPANSGDALPLSCPRSPGCVGISGPEELFSRTQAFVNLRESIRLRVLTVLLLNVGSADTRSKLSGYAKTFNTGVLACLVRIWVSKYTASRNRHLTIGWSKFQRAKRESNDVLADRQQSAWQHPEV